MIRQHIYRKGKPGYRTVAASARRGDEDWLTLAEQQVGLHYQSDLEAAVYYQYAVGGALVLSRCAVDPNGTRGSFLAHQLFVGEEEDARALFAARPLARSLFRDAYVERGEELEPLPTLAAPQPSEEALSASFRVLDRLFPEDAQLLSCLLCALRQMAEDRDHLLLLECGERPQVISDQGRQLMELLLRALPYETARRLSYCSYLPKPGYALSYSVSFVRECGPLSGGLAEMAVRFRLGEGSVVCPMDYRLAPTRQEEEMARALLAHDLNWVDRLCGRDRSSRARHPAVAPVRLPAFDSAMSLRQYVRDWAQEVEMRAGSLNERARKTYAREVWPSLLDQLIAASLLLQEGESFLAGMGGAIAYLRKESRALGIEPDMLADAATVLLDSIDWQKIDLTSSSTRKLIAAATGYGVLLPVEDPLRHSSLLVHYAVRYGPRSLERGLACIASLCRMGSGQLVRVQECLARYARACCRPNDRRPPMDDAFVTLTLLSGARYVDDIPDFRAYSAFNAFLVESYGAREARAFEKRFQALKRRTGLRAENRALSRESRLLFRLSAILLLLMAVFLAVYFIRRW